MSPYDKSAGRMAVARSARSSNSRETSLQQLQLPLEPARWELELAPQELSAYARLLLDIIEGDPSLSIRGDEAEECWRIVEPIIDAWRAGAPPLRDYPAGSNGLGGR